VLVNELLTEDDNKNSMSISCIISVCILLVTNAALENGVVVFMKAILEDRIMDRNERMNMKIMLGCVSES
jgi:hypothetical protein